jgi:hypothetical protein
LSIYTFYGRRPDGAPTSFEAYDLSDDQAAAVQAQVLLEQHMSAARIEVYDKDRPVLTWSRAAAVQPQEA